MSRFGRHGRVVFCEEPILEKGTTARVDMRPVADGVMVLQPRLPLGLSPEATDIAEAALLETAMWKHDFRDFVLWYYTPSALGYTEYLEPRAVVYDCVDEPGAFRGAQAEVQARERQLLARADLVFSGGRGFSEARRAIRPSVHSFPDSPDGVHWDRTWSAMDALLQARIRRGRASAIAPTGCATMRMA
jgi:UDP-galactopyranose mutase